MIVDYGDVLLHVFYEPVREFYQLEQLWFEAPLLPLELPEPPGASSNAGSTSE